MRRNIAEDRLETEPKGSAMQDALAAAGEAVDAAVLRTVPDLRGLEVEDASGLCVGALWGALAEADTGLLRYVDLDLTRADRHVLVPIGHARVTRSERGEPQIRLRAALLEELERIPERPADVEHIDDPFERELLEAYGRTFHGERYYAHPAYDHSGVYAGPHLVVDENAADADDSLKRLSYLPAWEIADGQPDIRGWHLALGGAGAPLEITDVVVDTREQKVRYAVVALESGSARLLPIGFLELDRDDHRVLVPGLTSADLAELPPYGGGGVTRDSEQRLHAALRGVLTGGRRYVLPDFRSTDS